MNKINITAQKTVGNYTVKLAEVGSGHHVISYRVTVDGINDYHEATMHSDAMEADEFYRARIRQVTQLA